MVYTMVIEVDGACRRNGSPEAMGVAAAVLIPRFGGRYRYMTRRLNSWHQPRATSQRAELTAIILGLEFALDKYQTLRSDPHLDVTIKSDSQYTVGVMNEWIYKWLQNGWRNARGQPVANQDLIEKASALDDKVHALGQVEYVYIPRSENTLADERCNEELDLMEEGEELERVRFIPLLM